MTSLIRGVDANRKNKPLVRPVYPMGFHGEHVLWRQPFTHVGDKRVNDRYGWTVDTLGVPVFDWANEGINPYIGPTMVTGGTPDAGQATPWIDTGGNNILGTGFIGNEFYRSPTPVDPAIGQDVILLFLAHFPRVDPVANVCHFATRTGNVGWQITSLAPGIFRIVFDSGPFITLINATFIPVGWTLLAVEYDSSVNLSLYVNGAFNVSAGALGHVSIANGLGLGLNAASNGGIPGNLTIARAMIWYGDDIADHCGAIWHRHLAKVVLGTAGSHNFQGVSYARTGSRIYDLGSRFHILSQDCPPTGSPIGRSAEDSHTTRTYKNCQLDAGDNAIIVADVGLVISDVLDLANIEAAGLRELGGRVFRAQNPTGGALQLRYGATVVDLSTHWVSVRARVVAGTVDLGLDDGAAWTKAMDIVAGYATRSVSTVTPANVNQQWALELSAGADVYFVLGCMDDGDYATPEVVNLQLAATATVGEGVLTLPAALVLDDLKGNISCDLTPDGWSTTVRGGTDRVLNRAGGNIDIAIADDSLQQLRAGDGTLFANAAIVEADGAEYKARWSWGDQGLRVGEDGGAPGQAAYDGSLGGAGDLESGGVGRSMKNLTIKRDQGGQP